MEILYIEDDIDDIELFQEALCLVDPTNYALFPHLVSLTL